MWWVTLLLGFFGVCASDTALSDRPLLHRFAQAVATSSHPLVEVEEIAPAEEEQKEATVGRTEKKSKKGKHQRSQSHDSSRTGASLSFNLQMRISKGQQSLQQMAASSLQVLYREHPEIGIDWLTAEGTNVAVLEPAPDVSAASPEEAYLQFIRDNYFDLPVYLIFYFPHPNQNGVYLPQRVTRDSLLEYQREEYWEGGAGARELGWPRPKVASFSLPSRFAP